MWTEKKLEKYCFLTNQRSGLVVALAHRVELPKSPEARAPLSEIVIVLVRVRRRRLQRTEGPGNGSPTLVSIDLDGVVRRRCGIIVCLVEPHVDEFVDVHAVRAGVLPRPRHELQVGLDVLARQVAADAIRVLQRGDVEGLRVLLAASFIIIADNIFPYVLVIFYNQRLILVSPQGHKKYYYYCQKDRWKEKRKKEEEVSVKLLTRRYFARTSRSFFEVRDNKKAEYTSLKPIHGNNTAMQKRNTSPNSSIMQARMAMRAPMLRPMGKT